MTNSTVSGNTAADVDVGGHQRQQGSARGSTLTLTDSTVSGNTGGGGIYRRRHRDTHQQHRLGQFAAGDGGGISIQFSGTLTLTNSSVEGNSAQSRGGGIFNAHGSNYKGQTRER